MSIAINLKREQDLDTEIQTIMNPQIRELTKMIFDTKVPEHFWTQPASSTGHHHPKDEHEVGGLVIHTKRVLKAAEVLMKVWPNPFEANAVRAACLLHDTARYGLEENPTKHSRDDHPILAASLFHNLDTQVGSSELKTNFRIEYAIKRHMGRWGEEMPHTPEDWIVHLSDMIASQYLPNSV